MISNVTRPREDTKACVASDADLLAEQLAELLHRSNVSTSVVNSVLAVLVTIVFRDLVPPATAFGWLGATLAFNFFRVSYLRRAAASGAYGGSAVAHRYAVLAAISGAIWGAGSLLFFPPAHVEYQVFLAFVLGGLTAGAGGMYAPYLPAFYAIAVPMLLPIVSRFALSAEELPLIMGTMLLLFGAFIASLAHSFHRTIRDAIVHQMERARLAEKQRTSQEFFSKAFQASPAPIAVTDPETSVFYDINQAWEKLTGYSRDETIGRRSVDLGIWVDPGDRPKLMDRLRAKGAIRGIQAKLRSKDGKIHELLASGDLIDTGDGPRFLFICHDVTHINEVARIKSEFISVVSHELRTPLTSIYGALKLVTELMTTDVPPAASDVLKIAVRNTTRLIELVNDILDFERLQSGKMNFEFGSADLCAIAKESVAQVGPFTDTYGARVHLNIPNEPIIVRGDVQRLAQVVVNLLSNAAKFSPRGGEIKVSVSRRDDFGRVEIADRGPGIPDSFRARIFDRFSQADSSTTRKAGGTGLGLNICKAIVDAHAGRIDYISVVGTGTTFYIEIPLEAARS